MSADEKIELYKWLWTMEVFYQNEYIDKLNNFLKHNEHFFQDYLIVYEAELRLKNFKQFSRDICLILRQ